MITRPENNDKNDDPLKNVDKTLFTIEGQKKMVDYTVNKSLKMFLVMIPIILIVVVGILYLVFNFIGII